MSRLFLSMVTTLMVLSASGVSLAASRAKRPVVGSGRSGGTSAGTGFSVATPGNPFSPAGGGTLRLGAGTLTVQQPAGAIGTGLTLAGANSLVLQVANVAITAALQVNNGFLTRSGAVVPSTNGCGILSVSSAPVIGPSAPPTDLTTDPVISLILLDPKPAGGVITSPGNGGPILNLPNGGLTVVTGPTMTISNEGLLSSPLTGPMSLTITGGTLTLSGANTYTGNTNVMNGTLVLANAEMFNDPKTVTGPLDASDPGTAFATANVADLGSLDGVPFPDGTTFRVSPNGTTVGTVRNATGVTLVLRASAVLAGAVVVSKQ